MIETIVLLVVILSASLTLCWSAKPRKDTEWQGEQAADMAGGLIIAAAAIGNLWLQLSGNESAILLLDSLAWYAALPLLVSVRVIQAAQCLGFNWYWDRMIWGRILLALCVVFELLAHSLTRAVRHTKLMSRGVIWLTHFLIFVAIDCQWQRRQ